MVKVIYALIALLAVFALGLSFYPNLFYSPTQITFSDRSTYEQEYIDDFFAITQEEYESTKENWLAEQIGGNGVFSSIGCYNKPQGPPEPIPRPPKEKDRLPPGFIPGMPDDACFWHAVLLAKMQQFGDRFTYGDLLKVLEEAKKQGLYQNSRVGGGRGTPLPSDGMPPEDFMKDLIARINYLDNFALAIGDGGGTGGGPGVGSRDILLIILPGVLGNAGNKALLKQASDSGNGIILNFICKDNNGNFAPEGHSVNVPQGGVTPNPACTSIKFKTENPNGEVEVDGNGRATGSSAPGVPLNCPPGFTAQLQSILIIETTQPGTPIPQAPSGSFPL